LTQTTKPAAGKNGRTPKAERSEREAAARGGGETTNGKPRAGAADIDFWPRASHVSVVGLFVIVVIWCAYVAQPVLVPVLLAWVIATIVLPIVKWLQERGVPRVLAAIAVALLLVAVIASLLVLLSTPVAYWLGRATEIGALIKEKLQTISQPLALLDEMRKTLNQIGADEPTMKVEQKSATVVATIFTILTPAVSQFILFIGALVFYLTYQRRLRDTVVLLLHDRQARLATLRTLSDIDANMTRYFGAFTIVNTGLAVATMVLAWFVGLPNPLLWGVLAGVLNYIPYIGPAIVLATLSVVSLITHNTLGEAAVGPLIFLGIVTVEGQFLTPTLMGRRLELNPFAVFLAVAFCTWLWGPLGAFLAVPVLMALSVTWGHVFAEAKPELPE
jgi:predicted PurR-regulated permease PerM